MPDRKIQCLKRHDIARKKKNPPLIFYPMCHKNMKLDEAENQAGQEERREKRQTECLDEHQPKRQNKDHPRNLPITNMYYNCGDLYEFFECCDELIPLYGTAEFEPLRQKIIERGWYLPMCAWRYYHTVLGVDYEYPAPRDPPN